MTKLSKVLVVVLASASICFFGFAAVSSSAMSNVREKLKGLQAERTAKDEELKRLQAKTPPIPEIEKNIAEVRAQIPIDVASLTRRGDVMAEQLKALNAEFVELSKKTIAKHEETQAVREEVQRLREEGTQLLNQLATLRSERESAERESRRLKDLLVQAEGMLERAEQRERLLKADGATGSSNGPALPGDN